MWNFSTEHILSRGFITVDRNRIMWDATSSPLYLIEGILWRSTKNIGYMTMLSKNALQPAFACQQFTAAQYTYNKTAFINLELGNEHITYFILGHYQPFYEKIGTLFRIPSEHSDYRHPTERITLEISHRISLLSAERSTIPLRRNPQPMSHEWKTVSVEVLYGCCIGWNEDILSICVYSRNRASCFITQESILNYTC